MLHRIKSGLMNCSLYHKILILNSIVIILPLLSIILFTYHKISGISRQEFSKYSLDTVRQINNNFTTYLNEMDLLAYMIAQNSEVQKALAFPAAGYELEKAKQKIAVVNFFNTLLNISLANNSLTIYGLNGELFYKGNSVLNYSYSFPSSPYLRLLNRQGKPRVFIPPHRMEYLMDKHSRCATILRAIYSADSGRLVGYVFLDIRDHVFDRLSGGNLAGQNMIFITSGRRVIYRGGKLPSKLPDEAPAKEELSRVLAARTQTGMVTLRGKSNYFFTAGIMGLTGWKIIALNSIESYYAKTKAIFNSMILAALACIFMSFLIAAAISSGITKPLKKLAALMQRVERDDFDIRFPVKYHDEISLLGRVFNHMVDRIKNLISSVYQSQLAEKDALILAFQSQINPHFLYNTLQSLSDQALREGADNVSEMSRRLSKMFRYTVDNPQRMVRLYDEVEHCRNYLFLQAIRYDRQFTANLNIPAELMNQQIPKFILQPLIENSILHGIYADMAAGVIEVTAERAGESLLLAVADNGAGIPEAQIREIRRAMNAGPFGNDNTEVKFLALNNINKRLTLLYGPDYGLQIESLPGQGTTVKIVIPADGSPA